jgi:mannosyltransferase OCH1-like enzyme
MKIEDLKKYLQGVSTIHGIPKIIHQTWKNEDVPDHWKISQVEWKRLCPDWKYVLWTDQMIEDYINQYYQKYIEMFKNFPYTIQRVDTIRYFILREFGGVYSDLDTVPLKSLNDYNFIDSDVYLVKSANTPCCYTNSFMISKPGIKLWDKMIDFIEKYDLPWYAWGKHLTVMTSTGPDALATVVNRYNDNICILPSILFNSSNVEEVENGMSKEKSVKNNAVLYSIPGSSWHDWDSQLINFFYMNINLTIFVCLLIIIWIFYIWWSKRYYQQKLDICVNSK